MTDWLKESLQAGLTRLANLSPEKKRELELAEEFRKAVHHHHNYSREPEKL